MCLPAAAVAAVSLTASAAGAVTSAIGSYYSAKQQRTQLQLQATLQRQQAQIAGINGENALAFAKTNSDTTLALAKLNDDLTSKIADANVAIATASSDFNQQVADGNGKIILARGEMDASIHEANAALSENAAQQALDAGNQQEQVSRLNYGRLKSTQRASLAANGVALDEGSSVRILSDTDYFSDVDADTLHTNAVRQAMGYRVQAVNETTAASFSRVDAQVQALQYKAQALGAKISSEVDIANTKLTASYQILQNDANARIEAANITASGNAEAFNAREQAIGFSASAAQSLVASKGINPALAGFGSLLNGASQVASQWYSLSKSGAFSSPGKGG